MALSGGPEYLAEEARKVAAELERGVTRPAEEVAALLRNLSFPAEWQAGLIRDEPVFVSKDAGPEVFYLGVDGTLYQLGAPENPAMPTRDAVIMRALLQHALGQDVSAGYNPVTVPHTGPCEECDANAALLGEEPVR